MNKNGPAWEGGRESGSSVDGRSVKKTPSVSAAITRLSSCANFLFGAYKWFTSGKGEIQSAIEPKSLFFPPFNIKVREIMVSLWSSPGTAYVCLHGVYDGTDCVVGFLWERRWRWSGYGLKKGIYSYGARANLLHANEQTSNGVLELHRHLLPHCIRTTTSNITQARCLE